MGSGHQFADASDQIGEPIRGLSGECFDRDDDVVDVERQRHQPASQCQRAQYGEGEQHPVSAPWRRIGIGGGTGTVGYGVGLPAPESRFRRVERGRGFGQVLADCLNAHAEGLVPPYLPDYLDGVAEWGADDSHAPSGRQRRGAHL